MKCIVSVVALVLMMSAPAAFAQTKKPDVSAAPSAQSSGAGIAGQPGNESGPAVKPTLGTGGQTAPNQQDPTVQQQDPSNVKGMQGSKSGPTVKPERGTVGSTAPNQQNPTVQQQDPSNIKGMPLDKSGGPAKQPSKE